MSIVGKSAVYRVSKHNAKMKITESFFAPPWIRKPEQVREWVNCDCDWDRLCPNCVQEQNSNDCLSYWTVDKTNDFCMKYDWLNIRNTKLGCMPCQEKLNFWSEKEDRNESLYRTGKGWSKSITSNSRGIKLRKNFLQEERKRLWLICILRLYLAKEWLLQKLFAHHIRWQKKTNHSIITNLKSIYIN
jgi:hypothetical protein